MPDKSASSPQPGSSNENQAPRPKQIVTSLKSNPNLSFKTITSQAPSGEMHKSIKLCSRKPLSKTMPAGQKLIVVSNAQSITGNSILQRTLTIPFVKNLAVKNFDKFKIVTTTSATTNVSAALATNTLGNNSVRHKVVTVRTNPATKKVSLSHLQVLNAKGSIKVLPFGGKILTKTATTPTSNLFIVNSSDSGVQALTKSTTSTPLLVTSKPQENLEDNKNVVAVKTESLTMTESSQAFSAQTRDVKTEGKSSVLAEILRASGVIASDSENYTDDIESQITQLTAIPKGVSVAEKQGAGCVVKEEQVVQTHDAAVIEAGQTEDEFHGIGGTYIIMGKLFSYNVL